MIPSISFFSGISLLFTTLSAICFASPLFRGKEEIEELSATYLGSNPFIMKALLRDRKIAYMGLSLLAFGVTFQILSIAL